jgi:ribosomal protein L40E
MKFVKKGAGRYRIRLRICKRCNEFFRGQGGASVCNKCSRSNGRHKINYGEKIIFKK